MCINNDLLITLWAGAFIPIFGYLEISSKISKLKYFKV